jgi:peptide methionine sulfoxide reductase msrA/msrB
VEGEALAYFAGGCFWGVEYFLEKLPGVIAVESGYMGGHLEQPTYEDVLTHTTGHLEAVRVRYDPARIDYETIARRFFEIHDPTQADGQGPDIGPQYRSAVFVSTEAERTSAQSLIARLRERGYDVVTEIHDATPFYMAEDYHQDYYVQHQKLPYCHGPVDRFGDGY